MPPRRSLILGRPRGFLRALGNILRNEALPRWTSVNFSYWTLVGNPICPIIVALRIGSRSQRRA